LLGGEKKDNKRLKHEKISRSGGAPPAKAAETGWGSKRKGAGGAGKPGPRGGPEGGLKLSSVQKREVRGRAQYARTPPENLSRRLLNKTHHQWEKKILCTPKERTSRRRVARGSTSEKRTKKRSRERRSNHQVCTTKSSISSPGRRKIKAAEK